MESSPARPPLASSPRAPAPARGAGCQVASYGYEPGRSGQVWARTKSHQPAGESAQKYGHEPSRTDELWKGSAPRASAPTIFPIIVIGVDTPQESMVKGKSGMHPRKGATT